MTRRATRRQAEGCWQLVDNIRRAWHWRTARRAKRRRKGCEKEILDGACRRHRQLPVVDFGDLVARRLREGGTNRLLRLGLALFGLVNALREHPPPLHFVAEMGRQSLYAKLAQLQTKGMQLTLFCFASNSHCAIQSFRRLAQNQSRASLRLIES